MSPPGPRVGDRSVQDLPGVPDAHVEVAAGITRVVTVTARSARLTTLDLRVTGRPDLAVLARGGAADGLVAWSVRVPADRWQPGLVLVATAACADAPRLGAVDDAAGLLHDLLAADGRRAHAEQQAVHAQRGVDALTGLGDRAAWEQALAVESARAARYGKRTCIAVVALDDLGGSHDARGRAEADEQLHAAAEALLRACRTVDTVCRLGRAELAVLAPETGPDGAWGLEGRLSHGLAVAGVEASLGAASAKDGDLDRAWRSAGLRLQEDAQQRRLRQGYR